MFRDVEENGTCVWWDEVDQVWSTSGCETNVVEAAGAGSTLACVCTHLTDFGILVSGSDGEDGEEDEDVDGGDAVAGDGGSGDSMTIIIIVVVAVVLVIAVILVVAIIAIVLTIAFAKKGKVAISERRGSRSSIRF
eukprot:TRINITY_DN1649_c0_g1_i1.p1 TRINITY_DN1649_c0_g1~~TRINITY_DN1649_c0_g1_i1.p1  ORF type:complete len:136 (+),score=32.50 TRINITY_DN1649_c0_g1_i1:100-507(+)